MHLNIQQKNLGLNLDQQLILTTDTFLITSQDLTPFFTLDKE